MKSPVRRVEKTPRTPLQTPSHVRASNPFAVASRARFCATRFTDAAADEHAPVGGVAANALESAAAHATVANPLQILIANSP